MVPAAPSTSSDCHGQSLCDTSLTLLLTRVHAVIDRKVAADHVGRFGGFVSGQIFARVEAIAGVLAVVNTYSAGPAVAGAARLEERIGPSPAMAQI